MGSYNKDEVLVLAKKAFVEGKELQRTNEGPVRGHWIKSKSYRAIMKRGKEDSQPRDEAIGRVLDKFTKKLPRPHHIRDALESSCIVLSKSDKVEWVPFPMTLTRKEHRASCWGEAW